MLYEKVQKNWNVLKFVNINFKVKIQYTYDLYPKQNKLKILSWAQANAL